MKLTRFFHLAFACAALAFPSAGFGQVGGIPGSGLASPAAAPAQTVPTLRIRSGQLPAAVDELSATLEKLSLSPINVIFAPEARTVQVPDLVLRNVTGADAIRLVSAAAGCDLEAIPGSDGQTIGYRIFPLTIANYGQPPSPGTPGTDTPFPGAIPGGAPSAPPPAPAPSPAIPPPAPPPIAPPGVVGFGPPPGSGTSGVRVYSLGGITNTTKFDEVETSLKDVLRADGVSSEAAKIAFHQRTNVLVVNGDARVQELVGQFLEALQKNVAAAAQEDARGGGLRQELIEAKIRMQAELEQRAQLSKRLDDTEAQLRETARELDRVKHTAPKPQ